MDYKTKIKHAEDVATQLQTQKSTNEIKSALEAEGLYERDVAEIIVSARNILEEKYYPKIEAYLKENKQIKGSEEFALLDSEVVDTLIARATQKMAVQEKRKIKERVKAGEPAEQILNQIDTRFLSADEAAEQIAQLQEIKKQNSGSGRMLNILGGIGLILLTGILVITIDRLFYFLPILGIIMIVKGITTQKME